MKGKHRIIVQNNRLHYEMDIKRNITVIQGDSATGKTSLVDMVRSYSRLGEESGITISCDVPVKVLEGPEWEIVLDATSNSIIIIDEGNSFITSKKFAEKIKATENYYVIITRENLYQLPYSVEEIYGMHSSGKYQDTRRVYNQLYNIYSSEGVGDIKPECLLIEDSNSGFEFFKALTADKECNCISAGGKTKVNTCLKKINDDKELCVIADGAAFGAEMQDVCGLIKRKSNIKLYLPESFEWLVLKSGIVEIKDIKNILDHPENYISSEKFFSWERFFTSLLVENTIDTPFKYSKGSLNPVYLHKKNISKIAKELSHIIL